MKNRVWMMAVLAAMGTITFTGHVKGAAGEPQSAGEPVWGPRSGTVVTINEGFARAMVPDAVDSYAREMASPNASAPGSALGPDPDREKFVWIRRVIYVVMALGAIMLARICLANERQVSQGLKSLGVEKSQV